MARRRKLPLELPFERKSPPVTDGTWRIEAQKRVDELPTLIQAAREDSSFEASETAA